MDEEVKLHLFIRQISNMDLSVKSGNKQAQGLEEQFLGTSLQT